MLINVSTDFNAMSRDELIQLVMSYHILAGVIISKYCNGVAVVKHIDILVWSGLFMRIEDHDTHTVVYHSPRLKEGAPLNKAPTLQ